VKRVARRFATSAVAATLALALSTSAKATIVERVVAVVGERPILLSDLRHRAFPFLTRIFASTQSPAERAAHETEMFRELLNRMIDDRLEEQAADKAHISVSIDEVDSAIRNVATQAKLNPKDLVAEAKRQGLTEQDYRDELRRQVLEGKLVQLRVRGRVKVSEDDGKVAYGRWLRENGEQSEVDVRILAMRLTPTGGAPSPANQARELLAADIVKRARSGADFCKLIADYSEDVQTVHTCGSRGLLPMSALVPAVQEAVRNLKEGETTDIIHYDADPRDPALLIVQLHTTPKVPSYAEVKDQMMDRAYGDAMERQRKVWLAELRHGVYVDVRL
jgi:peptidyl-prolyl cis-trans isomerase SurA